MSAQMHGLSPCRKGFPAFCAPAPIRKPRALMWRVCPWAQPQKQLSGVLQSLNSQNAPCSLGTVALERSFVCHQAIYPSFDSLFCWKNTLCYFPYGNPYMSYAGIRSQGHPWLQLHLSLSHQLGFIFISSKLLLLPIELSLAVRVHCGKGLSERACGFWASNY